MARAGALMAILTGALWTEARIQEEIQGKEDHDKEEAHDAKEDTAALWKLLGLATISSQELVESLDLTFDKSRLAEAVSRASFYVALALLDEFPNSIEFLWPL